MAGKHHPELRPVWESLTAQQQKEILAMMDEFGHDRYEAGRKGHSEFNESFDKIFGVKA